jgi:PTS system ascorbate-specific IIA component
VIAGVNLPMLLRAVCYRSGDLEQVVEKALAGGQQGMLRVAATGVQNQTATTSGNDLQRFQNQQ